MCGHFKDCDHAYYSGCSCATKSAYMVGLGLAVIALIVMLIICY